MNSSSFLYKDVVVWDLDVWVREIFEGFLGDRFGSSVCSLSEQANSENYLLWVLSKLYARDSRSHKWILLLWIYNYWSSHQLENETMKNSDLALVSSLSNTSKSFTSSNLLSREPELRMFHVKQVYIVACVLAYLCSWCQRIQERKIRSSDRVRWRVLERVLKKRVLRDSGDSEGFRA